VDVEVHHRLAGVEAVEEDFCLPGKGEEAGEFRVEELRDVPEGEFPSGQ